jgi:peptidoglycan/LPS O-acetylase OafA/YrhL
MAYGHFDYQFKEVEPTMKSKPRSISLDLLRIFACIAVITFHWSGHGGYWQSLKHPFVVTLSPMLTHLSAIGYLGVDLFFILSGLVITRTAVNRGHVDFFRARFARLFPALFLCTILTIPTLILFSNKGLNSDSLVSLSGLNWWIGGSPIIGATWSLAVEFEFYALVFFAIFLSGKMTVQNIPKLINGYLFFNLD